MAFAPSISFLNPANNSGSSNEVIISVDNYSDLPSVSENEGKTYKVLNETKGIFGIRVKYARGLYLSDGIKWNYIGDDNTSSDINITRGQTALTTSKIMYTDDNIQLYWDSSVSAIGMKSVASYADAGFRACKFSQSNNSKSSEVYSGSPAASLYNLSYFFCHDTNMMSYPSTNNILNVYNVYELYLWIVSPRVEYRIKTHCSGWGDFYYTVEKVGN